MNINEKLGVPRSKEFDDVYFSAENGLAETRHVFLAGNDLAARFADLRPGDEFVIGETGFGTGLNFLAAAKLFQEVVPKGASLRFVSVEKFPLSAGEIENALSVWREDFDGLMDEYLKVYKNLSGTYRIDKNLALELFVGDANTVMAGWGHMVDAWFLDGFKPSSNPDMWSEIVFENMARVSKSGTTLATFTAAGFVRRGLAAAGFEVKKVRGFGTKRDMTVGVYRGVER